MQSTGEVGRIHLSSETHQRVQHMYEFEKREIPVKGKGVMDTYLLIGPRANPQLTKDIPRKVRHSIQARKQYAFKVDSTVSQVNTQKVFCCRHYHYYYYYFFFLILIQHFYL